MGSRRGRLFLSFGGGEAFSSCCLCLTFRKGDIDFFYYR